MKNLKFTIGFSVFGFLLSIFSSLHTVARSIGMRFFIALCFALCFAFLAVLIEFVMEKVSSTESFQVKNEENSQASPSSQAVDIVIKDEELPSEEGASEFFVGKNHQMLTDEDLQEAKSYSENLNEEQLGVSVKKDSSSFSESTDSNLVKKDSSTVDSGFVPLNFSENQTNISGVESKTIEELKSDEKKAKMSAMPDFNISENLDVLPDLENIPEIQTEKTESETGFSQDSEFSENKSANTVSSSSFKEKTDGQDAQLMAKAISTLLSKDK